jgi:hypothetical protein
MIWIGHVGHVKEMRFYLENLKGKDHLRNKGTEKR